jgi:hypothetical protein
MKETRGLGGKCKSQGRLPDGQADSGGARNAMVEESGGTAELPSEQVHLPSRERYGKVWGSSVVTLAAQACESSLAEARTGSEPASGRSPSN